MTEQHAAAAPAQSPTPSYWSMVMGRSRTELQLFFSIWENVFFIFLFPVIMFVIFATVFGDNAETGDVSLVEYFLPAMLGQGFLLASFQSVGLAVASDREKGVLKRLRASPMPQSVYFLGKVALVMVTSLGQSALLLLTAWLAFDATMPNAAAWLTVGWIWLLSCLCGGLLAVAFCSLVKSAKAANALITPIVIMLPFISGVYFMASELPKWLSTIGALFPLKWQVQGLKSAFLPDAAMAWDGLTSWQLPTVALVLAAWAVIGAGVAFTQFKWTNSS